MINISVDMGRFTLSGDGENIKEAMKSLSDSGGLEFLSEKKCGVCGCSELFPSVREVLDPSDKKGKSTYTYYELACGNKKCWAKLSLGQKKSGDQLFPKRKSEDGEYLPNNGWIKYEKPTE